MILDVILIAILLVWTIAGYRKGFVRQIFSLAGLVLMLFFARPLAEITAEILKNEADVDLLGLQFHAMLVAICASSIYICFYLLGLILHKTLIKGIKIAEKLDHVLGASLGFIQAFIVCYFALCLIDALESKIERYAPSVALKFSTSKSLKYMEGRNYLASFFQDINQVNNEAKLPASQTPNIDGITLPKSIDVKTDKLSESQKDAIRESFGKTFKRDKNDKNNTLPKQ